MTLIDWSKWGVMADMSDGIGASRSLGNQVKKIIWKNKWQVLKYYNTLTQLGRLPTPRLAQQFEEKHSKENKIFKLAFHLLETCVVTIQIDMLNSCAILCIKEKTEIQI